MFQRLSQGPGRLAGPSPSEYERGAPTIRRMKAVYSGLAGTLARLTMVPFAKWAADVLASPKRQKKPSSNGIILARRSPIGLPKVKPHGRLGVVPRDVVTECRGDQQGGNEEKREQGVQRPNGVELTAPCAASVFAAAAHIGWRGAKWRWWAQEEG